MNKKLLTIDIIFFLIAAVFGISISEMGWEKETCRFIIPILLTAYYAGRYGTLYVAKKSMKNQK